VPRLRVEARATGAPSDLTFCAAFWVVEVPLFYYRGVDLTGNCAGCGNQETKDEYMAEAVDSGRIGAAGSSWRGRRTRGNRVRRRGRWKRAVGQRGELGR
jgi:hypothetical protein